MNAEDADIASVKFAKLIDSLKKVSYLSGKHESALR